MSVRIEDDAILGIMDEPDRHHLLELAAASAAQNAAAEARFEHMQFRLAHRALQAQQQAIVEVRRIIQSVLIEDESIR